MTQWRLRGFTLIELMIVIAILGILAAIALPVFQDQIRKSRRSDGREALLNTQLLEEKYRASNSSYDSLANIGALTVSADGHFNVSVVFDTNTYTITATAATADQNKDTLCKTMALNQDNTRTPAACW